MSDAAWEAVADRFVTEHYGSLRGRVRTEVLHRHLLEHLPAPPAAVADVGGGAGHQSLPLARAGYEVTVVDPSRRMLELARELLALESAAVRRRVRFVEARGEAAVGVLGEGRFAGVLCHGVLMYVDAPDPLVGALAALTAPGGVVSLVAKSARALAVRPALLGRWAEALEAFDAVRQVNELGIDTRADTVEGLEAALRAHGVEPVDWYGVRLFVDGWTAAPPADADLPAIVAVELEASRRDPYRQLSRLFHLVGRR